MKIMFADYLIFACPKSCVHKKGRCTYVCDVQQWLNSDKLVRYPKIYKIKLNF